jgi:hypothetical protein
MEEQKRITDQDYNNNWNMMLKVFLDIPLNAPDTK